MFSSNKTEKIGNEIKISNYVSLEYGSFDNNGELIHCVSPIIF